MLRVAEGAALATKEIVRVIVVALVHFRVWSTKRKNVLVISHGVSHKIGEWGAGEEKLSYTRVLVRQGGDWRLADTQAAPSSSMPDPRASRAAEESG